MESANLQGEKHYLLALYAAFYLITTKTELSTFRSYLDLACRFLYKISFPTSLAIPGSTIFPLSFMHMIRDLWTYNADMETKQITSYIVSVSVLANYVYLAYLVMFYLKHRTGILPNTTIMNTMNSHLYWTCGLLSVPYVSILVNYTSCGLHTKQCHGGTFGEAMFFLIVALFHSLAIVIYDTSVYSWSPFNHLPSSKAHHRATLLGSTFKCLSTLLFGFFGDWSAAEIQYALVGYFMAQSMTVLVYHWYDYPYYQIHMNVGHMFVHGSGFMVGLGMLLGMESDGSGDIVAWGIMIVGNILLCPTIYSAIEWRLNKIEKTPIVNLKNQTDIDIKIRLLMMRINEGYDSEVDIEYGEHHKEIERIFQESKGHKDSFKFHLTWSIYTFFYQKNKFFAMSKLKHVLTHSRMLFDIIPLQVRIRIIAEDRNQDSLDEGLDSYEEQVRLEKISLDAMSKCLAAQLRFWGMMISGDYNFQKLEKWTFEINYHMDTARHCLQRMVFLNPKSPFYRKLYSQYLLNIANDDNAAKRQLTRAMELESEDDAKYNISDSGRCILIISGERDSMGEIIEANNKTCEVFGVSSEDIIGRKINMLMAKPYAIAHNGKIITYIEKKHRDLNSINLNTILKSSNGLVFEGQLQIREYPNFTMNPSISFFGSINPMPDRNFCIIKKADNTLWEVSSKFANLFRVDVPRVKTYELDVFEVLPSLRTVWEFLPEELQNRTSYTFPLKQDGISEAIEATVSYLPFLPRDYYFMLIYTHTALETKIERKHYADGRSASKIDLLIEKVRGARQKEKKLVRVRDQDDPIESQTSMQDLKDPDQTQSEVSTSSKGSKSSQLLRLGLSRQGNGLERNLKLMFNALLVLLVTLCTMGIVLQLLWSNLTINRYQSTLDLLSLPLRFGTTTASYSANIFDHLFYNTLYETEEQVQREEARIRREFEAIRMRFQNLKTILFNAGKSLSVDEVNRITSTEYRLYDYAGDVRVVKLVDVVNLYNTAINHVLNNTFAQLKADQRQLMFLKSNVDYDLPPIWDDTCLYILEIQEESANQVQTVEFAFMLAAITLVLLSFFGMFLPVTVFILRQKTEIYLLFERMEVGNLRAIVGQCTMKIGELDGVEQTTNNMEIQDMMEVISSKAKNAKLAEAEAATKPRSRLGMDLKGLMINKPMLLFLGILSITIAYFVGFYFWWLHYRDVLFNDVDTRVYESRNRNWYCRKLSMSVTSLDTVTQTINVNLAETELWERKITEMTHALSYGDKNFNLSTDIRVMPGGEEILYGNVCQQLYKRNLALYNDTACEEYFDGVLTRGSHELYLAFVSLAEDYRRLYVEKGYDAVLPHIRAIKDMADNWIPNVSSLLDSFLSEGFIKAFSSAANTRLIGTVMYVVISVLIGAGVLYPLMSHLNNELQRTRNLLVIIPNEIVEDSAILRDQIRDLALKMIQSR
jgi:PAS domain S-box-containing protein